MANKNTNRSNDANRGAGEANAANTDKRPDDMTNTKPAVKEDTEQNTTTDVGNITDQVAAKDGEKYDPMAGNPPVYDANQPTIQGYTAENNGTIAPKETKGLETIDRDKASDLRSALDNILGYQTGSTYRHDFESGVETLRKYGLGYNEAQADNDAKRAQDEVLANEAGQVSSSDGNSDK